MKHMKYINQFLVILMLATGLFVTSCEDEPDKYKTAGGVPTVHYVRLTDPAYADSLLVGAYMSNTICLVGENLRSVYEIYFNDQKAVLNTSLITDHTLIVTVPGNIPEVVTDKIYMINKKEKTVEYDFKVLVPGPVINSMSCEYTKPGEEATIYGDYLLNDPNVPLTITMAGNVPVREIRKITKNAVTFVVPAGAESGNLSVRTIYGTGRSKFRYMDDRNMLFDWDGVKGLATAHGWRNGNVQSENPAGIDGNYVIFQGSLSGEQGADWAEDPFSFNYWPEPGEGYPELSTLIEGLDDWQNMSMKFEYYIPTSNPWESCSLQMIFTSNDMVTYATGNNGYIADESVPRGLWTPWATTGSWDTGNRWMTATIPMSDFRYKHTGVPCDEKMSEKSFAGLTFFVYYGPYEGKDCTPVICIDNIRIVPAE